MGKGLATEAAKAVLDFAFDTLGLKSVKADVDEPNVMSVRILEKLGMRRIRRARVAGRPLLYYEQYRNTCRAVVSDRRLGRLARGGKLWERRSRTQL